MSSTASEVDICNMALGWLGSEGIMSLDDPSTQAILCKLNYPRSRDVTLEAREWTFAVYRIVLTPEIDAPEFQWTKKLLIPTDMLTVLTVDRENNAEQGLMTNSMYQQEQAAWVREGQYILCDLDVAYVRGIKRIEATTLFSESYVHALAARLAMDLAIPITRSKTLLQGMTALYMAKLQDAAAIDGLQGRSQRIRSRYLSKVR